MRRKATRQSIPSTLENTAKDALAERDSDEEEESADEDAEEEFVAGMTEELNEASGKRKLEEVEEQKLSKKPRKAREEDELKELAKSMMSKKAKRLYDRMHYGINAKSEKVAKLEQKRSELQKNNA